MSLLGDNTTICKLGIDLRGMLPQTELDRRLSKNRELARKARQREKTAVGGGAVKKPKGKMQEMFAKVAKDDPDIMEVNVVGDKLFLSMRRDDKLQAAKSFATNTHIETVKLAMLELDDEFAVELAKSIEQNKSITKLVLDSNMISGDGIKALVTGLGRSNRTLAELQVRHQKKPLPTKDEESLPGLLAGNDRLVKLGVDLRSPRAQRELDNMLSRNRERQRSIKRAASSSSS